MERLTPAQRAAFERYVERFPANSANTYLTYDKRLGRALARKGLVEQRIESRNDYRGTRYSFGRKYHSVHVVTAVFHLTEAGRALAERIRAERETG